MSVSNELRNVLKEYVSLKEALLAIHGSEEHLFMTFGHEYPTTLEERGVLFAKLHEDISGNIEPLLVMFDPTDKSIEDDARVTRLSWLAEFLGNHKHAHTNTRLANSLLKSGLSEFGFDTSSFPEDWQGYHTVISALSYTPSDSDADDLLESLKKSGEHVSDFFVACSRLKQKQDAILQRSGVSNSQEYFSKNRESLGVNINGYNHGNRKHRLKLFEKLHEKRKGEAAIMALDPFSDITEGDTIVDLGFLLQWPDSGVYAPEISEGLFTHGAIHFASAMSAFRLGHHYNNGNTGRVDHNASVFWFDVATRLGHGVAPKFMYQILASEDERFGDPNEPEFNAYMDSLMQKAEDMGFPCSVEWLNRRYAFGAGKYNDQKRVVSGYENVIEEQFLAPPQLSSLMAYAMRSVLLDNVTRSYEDIIANIHAGIKKNGLQSFYTSDLELPLRQIDKIREKLKSSNEYSSHFRTLGDWVRAYYHQEVTQEQFEETIGKVMALGQTSQVEAYRDALWLGRTLAREEGWYITYDIAKAFEKVHAVCLGLDDEQLRRSAMIMGPFYNAIDPDNALPILGEHLPASQSDEEVEIQRITLGAFVPQPGIVAVNSITGENDGSITFDFKPDETSPALILEEDIHVAMALAFGDKEKPLWPSLSLEKKDPDVLPDDYEQFSTKVWNPTWLGHTDFGKTLYIVDRLAGQLTWSPRSFTIAKPEDCFDPEFPEYAKNLLEDLRFTGGADRSSHSKMINVSPEYIPLKIEKTKKLLRSEQWRVPLDTIRMRVNGAYTLKHEDREKEVRDIGWNDTTFGQGRLTQRLTDHYSDISLMMPVFERARQLSGMTYGLMKLRAEGFKLGRKFQDEASATLSHFRGLPALPRSELVMKQQPFKLDFTG